MGRNSVRTYPPAQRNSVRTYNSVRRISVKTYLSAGGNSVRTYPPARRRFPCKILKNDDNKPVRCARCHRTYGTRKIFEQHLPTCSSDFILTVSECYCKKTRSSEVDKRVYNNAFVDVKHKRCEPKEQNENAVQLPSLSTVNVSIESSQTSPAELTNRTNSTLLFYSVMHQPIDFPRNNESNVIDPPTKHQSPLLAPITTAIVSSITTPTIFSQNSLKTTQMDTRFVASIVPQVVTSDVSKQSAHPLPLPPSRTVQTSVLSSMYGRPTDVRSESWTYAQAASQSQTSSNINCQPAVTATATATPMPGPQYQMHTTHTPCVQAPTQPEMFVQQVQSPNVVPAFVDAFQQHTGQSLDFIGRIDVPSKDPLFTPTAGSVASGMYQLQTSDGFTDIQIGSIPVMSSPSQSTVLGTIIPQERPAALQCSTVATEKRVFGSTTGMEIFTDQNDGVTVVERTKKTSLTTQKKNMKSLKMVDSECNTSGNKNEMEICFSKVVAPKNHMASINLVDSEHNTSVNISESVEVSFDKIAGIEIERVEVGNDTVESRHFRRREKTSLTEPKKPMKSLKMIDSMYNTSQKVNEPVGDCFEKIDAPREHTESIKMVDSEHTTSANISESMGVSFDKIAKIEENERVEVGNDPVESRHFRRREKTSLTESKKPMKSLKMVDSECNTSEKVNEPVGDCFDNIDAPREHTESIKMVDSEHNTSANICESVGVCFDNIDKTENDSVIVRNDTVESRHLRNTLPVLPNQGTRQTNALPDSPISMTESSDSNDLPLKRKILKRRKRIGAQRVKNVKKFSKDSIYEVEYILDYVEFEKDAYYLVKWKNWESKHNSWEPKENVTNCEKILNEYFSSVYGSFTNSRECIDSFGKTLVKPTRETLEELMSSLVKDGVVQYEVPSLRKVCMALNALLGLPEVERRSESVDSLKMFIMLRCLHVKRKRQLKSLKEWEDEINASSNTAAHIVVENEVDLEGPPDNFYYVNEYIPGKGVSIPDEPPIGCNCNVCSAETCSCVKESGGQFPYCPNGTIKISSRFPVYECNKLCKCSDNCVNRVVQKGCRAKLSIFRTSNGCGWGVKALESIPKGSFLCEYVGEVINTEEAEVRGQEYDSVGQTYLFDLDFNDKEHCPYTVDAAFLGNISHFFNHSCSPNLTVHAVWINCLDPDLPKLAFFAKKPIQANQEITFDYHAQTVIPRASTSNKICKCKSVHCRKYLF